MMGPIKRLLLLAMLAAGLQLAPSLALAHGGCPETAAASDTAIQGQAAHAHRAGHGAAGPDALDPGAIDSIATPAAHGRHASRAIRAVEVPNAGRMRAEPASARAAGDAHGVAASGDRAGDCGHDGPVCCSMPACGSVCHVVAPVDFMALETPAGFGRPAMREVPDPGAQPAEVALPPPRVLA